MESTLLQYASLLDTLHEGAYLVDINKKILYWNKSAEKILGYKSADVVNRSDIDTLLVHMDENGAALYSTEFPISKTLLDGNIQDAALSLLHKEGYRIPVRVRILPCRDLTRKVIGAIELFKHSSEKDMESGKIKELVKLSFIDSVTNLVNRKYADSKLNALISEMKIAYIPLGILIFEITKFKELNEIYGSSSVDALLKNITQTLQKSAMQPNVILCRWGGSQFMIIHPNAKRAVFFLLANKLKSSIEFTEFSNGLANIELNIAIGGTIVKPSDTLQSFVSRAEDMLNNSRKDDNNAVKIDS